jgi:hypothetical protein
MCVRGINFASFYDLFIGCWHCSDSVVLFYWMLALFWQCGIFLLDVGIVLTVWYFFIGYWHCSDSVLFFLLDVGIVLTVWYFFYCMLALFWQCAIFFIGCWHCSDSVLFFFIGCWHCSDSEVFFLLDVGIVLTVPYFFYWMLALFWQCGIFLLDVGIVLTMRYFFYWMLTSFWQCAIFIFILFYTLDKDKFYEDVTIAYHCASITEIVVQFNNSSSIILPPGIIIIFQ